MRQFLLGFISLAVSAVPIIGQGRIGFLEFILLSIAALNIAVLFARDRNSYSVQKVINLFSLFFFAIAPAVQFHNNVRMLDTHFSEDDYTITALTALGVMLLFNGCYDFLWRKNKKKWLRRLDKRSGEAISPASPIKNMWAFALALVVFAVVLWINSGSILSMLFRGGEFSDLREIDQSVVLIVGNFVRPMAVPIFLLYYIKPHKSKIVVATLALLMLLADSPTGMARFAAFSLYLPVVLIVFPAIRRRNVFVFSAVVAVLVFLPFLNLFRYFSSDTQITFEIGFDQFEDLNFDAFSMFMRTLTNDVVTYGRQLIGALFFFIPRALWPSKPVGSGHYLADIQNLSFGNISMPYFSEGYINFGIIGVIIFTLLIAWIAARLDFWYWNTDASRGGESYQTVQYYIFLGCVFFMMRGDLLSSFAYTMGMITACWVARKFMG